MDFGRLSGRSFLDRVAPPRSLAWHALACIFYMHGYIYIYNIYIYYMIHIYILLYRYMDAYIGVFCVFQIFF